MQLIPLTTDARQRLRVTVGGQPVVLRAWWQPLSEAWYVSLYSRREEPIAVGRQVSVSRRLIEAPAFDGEFVVLPVGNGPPAMGRESWDATHRLVYFSSDEVELLGSVI